MANRVLLVEDEVNLRNSIKLNLDMEGYEVSEVGNGREAVDMVEKSDFDLIIMDYMMPKMDGVTACAKIRAFNTITPILFLSAKSQPQDRIDGLKAGANDYLGKPFHLEELLLRVKNLLSNRIESAKIKTASINNRKIDFEEMKIVQEDQVHQMSKKECDLLRYIIDRNGAVVSRNDILDNVWGTESFPSPRTVDNFILNLRKRLETDPTKPRLIRSVRGIGYKIDLIE